MCCQPSTSDRSTSTDTIAPTASITSPANRATVSGTITVTAAASDNVAVTRVEFWLDGVLQGTDATSPYSWSWDTTTATSGGHSLFSQAFDAAGNMGSSSAVNVTVDNAGDTTPPSAPGNLTASPAKRKINLSWAASTDDVGVIPGLARLERDRTVLPDRDRDDDELHQHWPRLRLELVLLREGDGRSRQRLGRIEYRKRDGEMS